MGGWDPGMQRTRTRWIEEHERRIKNPGREKMVLSDEERLLFERRCEERTEI